MVRLLPWIILFSPLAAAAAICLFSMKWPKLAETLSLAGILVSLAASLYLFSFYLNHPALLPVEWTWPWIRVLPSTRHLPGLAVDFGFLIDRLSILMTLIVSGVSSCIFLYSIGYMRGDSSLPRYFASLSLFAFSMLGIVLANNFLMLFVFWELVAVSSYLLIGFWFEKPSAADAGNKAFLVNRVADFGFVLGIFYLWMLSGAGDAPERTFSFSRLAEWVPRALAEGLVSEKMLVAAALLVFCGVVGKSAQFPLYIWLPDAMEGPTPVSALIHAATMVAAGVYLLARAFFLVSGLPAALQVMAWIGVVTAILSALLAAVQNDIKKILAYSTISQLGFMVAAIGLGSSTAAMYHLSTHAFFKALLFLGAGAMIHSLHTQDIWEMGGLLKPMPVTAVTFLIGALALCGLYPFSGFFSKDEILALAREKNLAVYVGLLATAGLTAFYVTRASWIAVLGETRSPKHSHGHKSPPEAPAVMKIPLVVLALLSTVAGFMGIPRLLMGSQSHEGVNLAVAITATLVSLAGIAAGSFLYSRLKSKEDPLIKFLGGSYRLLVKKYYLDELFIWLASLFQYALAKILFWFDVNVVIQNGVNGAARATSGFGAVLRRAQNGRVQTYATVFGFGVVALVYFVMRRS